MPKAEFDDGVRPKMTDYFNYKKIKKFPHYHFRAYLMGWMSCICLILILSRYAWIGFFPTPLRSKLIQTGSRQFETNLSLAHPRATITDRNGRVLAVSVSRPSMFLLTKRMPRDREALNKVSQQIQVPIETLLAYRKEKRNFIWLKRQMSQTEFLKLGSLKKWQGFIGIIDEPKRIYPEKDIATHLIGFVGSEGHGLEGIEKIYNSRLNIKPVTAEVMRDARGRLAMITPNDASKPDQQVPQLVLSIDVSIQEITQNALRRGVLRTMAKGGSALVMDVKTGEILSIASYPTYDLNNPPENNPSARRFRPVMDAIELGSVVKPMWIAKGLDMGVIEPASKIFAEYGKLALPGGVIHDTRAHGWLTPAQIIKVSSNIGAYKVVQKIGKENFYDALMKIGFGRQPGTGLPGEWGGRIRTAQSWREMNFANMSFGQGFAISPLQLAYALCLIVGGGIDRGVNLIAVDGNREKNFVGPPLRYIQNGTSTLIAQMMKAVVEEEGGTGSFARIPGILVAGKTGTAQIWSSKDQSYSGRTAVFEGLLPADDPKLVVVVVLDEVTVRPVSGGALAGPVFAEIGKDVVQYLNSQGIFKVTPYENVYLKKHKLRQQDFIVPVSEKVQQTALSYPSPIQRQSTQRNSH